MALKTMISKLTKARSEYEQVKKEIGSSLGEAIAQHLAEHLPPGYVLQWTGGTPSFNDGDPCRFSCHRAYLKTEEQAENGDDGEYLSQRMLERYGTPDEEKEYEQNDYSKPRLPDGSYPKKVTKYVDEGFPKIEGYSKEKLAALIEAWQEVYDDDLMETAFGDGFKITVRSDGTHERDEWYCD